MKRGFAASALVALVFVSLATGSGAGHAAGLGLTTRDAAVIEPPVIINDEPNGQITKPDLLGASADGSYAVQQQVADGSAPNTAYVVEPDGSIALQVGVPSRVVEVRYSDGILWYEQSAQAGREVLAYPVTGSSWSVTTSASVLGLAGSAGVLVQEPDFSLELIAPGGTTTVLGNPGAQVSSVSADAAGGLACVAAGQAYFLDLTSPAVTPVAGVANCRAPSEHDGVRAVLTTDGTVVRLGSDGTPGPAVQVPYDGALGNPYLQPTGAGQVPSQLVATAGATFVLGYPYDYAGPAAGPLRTLGQENATALAAGAGDTAYVVSDQNLTRIDATTSPAPVASLGAVGGTVPREPVLGTNEPGIGGGVSLYEDPDGQLDGRMVDVDGTELTAGVHTFSLEASASTGYGPWVTQTATVVAHPTAAVLGTNHAVYELSDGHAVSLGGYGLSPPSVTTIGGTVFFAVEGGGSAVYLRTEHLGWTRVTTGVTCHDPTIEGHQDPNGVDTVGLACVNEQHALIRAYVAVQSNRIGAAAGPGGVVSASDFTYGGGVVSGGPITMKDGGIYVRGSNGIVYRWENFYNEFQRTALHCAGPLGGGSALVNFNSAATVLGCAQPDGALALLTNTGSVVSVGGIVTGEPAIAVQSDGSAVLTVICSHDRLYQETFTGTKGGGWHQIGGLGALGVSGSWADGP